MYSSIVKTLQGIVNVIELWGAEKDKEEQNSR